MTRRRRRRKVLCVYAGGTESQASANFASAPSTSTGLAIAYGGLMPVIFEMETGGARRLDSRREL